VWSRKPKYFRKAIDFVCGWGREIGAKNQVSLLEIDESLIHFSSRKEKLRGRLGNTFKIVIKRS
jgi:hypothetical protein